jgi:hypothetical protein
MRTDAVSMFYKCWDPTRTLRALSWAERVNATEDFIVWCLDTFLRGLLHEATLHPARAMARHLTECARDTDLFAAFDAIADVRPSLANATRESDALVNARRMTRAQRLDWALRSGLTCANDIPHFRQWEGIPRGLAAIRVTLAWLYASHDTATADAIVDREIDRFFSRYLLPE